MSRAPRRVELASNDRIAALEPGIGAARRIFRPVRRAHALHPAALLVDQNGRVVPSDRRAQCIAQRPHLLGRFHVAPEQDESPRLAPP